MFHYINSVKKFQATYYMLELQFTLVNRAAVVPAFMYLTSSSVGADITEISRNLQNYRL